MTTAVDLHRAEWAAIARYDWEAMRSLYHPEYEYTDITGTVHTDTDVPVAVMATLHAAFPDVVFTHRAFYDCGTTSVTEVVCTGTHLGPLGPHPATRTTVTMHAAHVVEARDGLILRERDYFDMASIHDQITVAAPAATR